MGVLGGLGAVLGGPGAPGRPPVGLPRPLGRVLGPVWGGPGALLGHLGRMYKNVHFPEENLRKINDFGGPGRVLGGSRGGLGASWGRLGGLLGSLGRVLGRLGSVLGPLEGVLGRLGASWRGPEADFVTPTALFEGPRPGTL